MSSGSKNYSVDVNELIKNIDVNNIEKYYELIQVLMNENEIYKEENFGFKFVTDEQRKKLNKFVEEINTLKQSNEKLNSQLKLYENQKGGFKDNIINMIKNYSKNISEERKRELKEKYKKYIFGDGN